MRSLSFQPQLALFLSCYLPHPFFISNYLPLRLLIVPSFCHHLCLLTLNIGFIFCPGTSSLGSWNVFNSRSTSSHTDVIPLCHFPSICHSSIHPPPPDFIVYILLYILQLFLHSIVHSSPGSAISETHPPKSPSTWYSFPQPRGHAAA
jgi:hypothetical protein